MSHQLICAWLELSSDRWPPDHYQLLGLAPGEPEFVTIEQHVCQRLETVRRYQLTHPESATEAMNRLAQAFVCLTDPASKKSYDLGVLGRYGGLRLPDSAAASTLQLDEAPAVLTHVAPAANATGPAQADMDTQIEAPLPEALPAAPVPAPTPKIKVDPAVEAAASAPARRGLGTRTALYRRIARTRQLMRAWDAVGKYLVNAGRRITRPGEATEFIEQLSTLRALLRHFPPLLGAAGQPGYLVLALARMHVIVPTYQTLSSHQREALARDWEAGRKLLAEHREFLRQELRQLRRRGALARAFRAVAFAVTDQPWVILLLVALIALNVMLWRQVNTTGWLKIFRSTPSVHTEK